jgi:hypothetical protein
MKRREVFTVCGAPNRFGAIDPVYRTFNKEGFFALLVERLGLDEAA